MNDPGMGRFSGVGHGGWGREKQYWDREQADPYAAAANHQDETRGGAHPFASRTGYAQPRFGGAEQPPDYAHAPPRDDRWTQPPAQVEGEGIGNNNDEAAAESSSGEEVSDEDDGEGSVGGLKREDAGVCVPVPRAVPPEVRKPKASKGGGKKKKKRHRELNEASASASTKKYRQCQYDGCYKYKQTGCDGMCVTHYELVHPGEKAPKKISRLCRYKDCVKYSQTRCEGLCRSHYSIMYSDEQGQGPKKFSKLR